MDKKTFIYGLYSEDDGIIRYVGKADDPAYRLRRHIHQRNNSKTHKNCWIKKLLLEKKGIGYKILEEVDNDIWPEREKYWISQFDNLVNTSKGGLGGGTIKYEISYEDCKNWVSKNLSVNSKSEWYKIKELPEFIAKNPREVYINRGWISWGDFLGTNRIQDNQKIDYISYDEAKNWIKENKISLENLTEWKKIEIPSFLPRRPERYYKNRGWISWSDFLSNDRVQNQKKFFLNYDDCVKWLSKNYTEITSHRHWKTIRKDFPDNIPTNPNVHYVGKGWIDWKTFFSSINFL